MIKALRLNKVGISKGILLIVALQLFLLINLTPSESYIIHQTDGVIETANIENSKQREQGNNVLNYGLNLLVGFLTIDGIGSVSASSFRDTSESPLAAATTTGDTTNYAQDSELGIDVSWNCCPLTTSGATCQSISSDDEESCAVSKLPTKCENTIECKIGCCVDPIEGTYSTNAPYQKCFQDGGVWYDNKECLIPEAQRGCCVLGQGVSFVTETRCNRLSLVQGFAKDFRDTQTEIECLALGASQETGACVSIGGRCSIETEIECAKIGGQFNAGLLCSNSALSTDCQKQASVGCAEGEHEIYWFDSCGNKENIYNANKDVSWNNGNILGKNESCNPNSANINSKTCGNCNYFLGSICSPSSGANKVNDGNFICEDLTCIDEKGEKRENGESWCVYDSYIGDGKDPAGSRHWKRYCIDGEVKVEPCADYRGEICVQSEITTDDGKKFTGASCSINEATICIMDKNKDKTSLAKCEENPDCLLKHINVDKGFTFDFCTSRYPRGFDLTGENYDKESQLCAVANQKCTVIYEKKISGWKCVFNCNCEKGKFAEQMNDLCISLGDCGSYVNYVGDGTDSGIKIKNDGDVSWQDYKKYAKPVAGQYAEPKNINEILGGVFGAKKGKYEGEEASSYLALGTVSGLLGFSAIAFKTGGIAEAYNLLAQSGWVEAARLPAGQIAAVAKVFLAAGIILIVSGLLTKAFGLSGQAAQIMTAAGVVGAASYVAWVAISAKATAWCLPCLIIILIVLLILAIILKILGIGKIKKIIVKSTCMPWERPSGGANCEKCNEDPLKPCTEYKCLSLGQSCQIVNPNDENPVCINNQSNDNTPPTIKPGTISAGFKFTDAVADGIKIRQDDSENNCIPEFTSILFSLETNEFSQCRYDYEKKNDFDDMSEFFLEQNSYKKNHTNAFIMPSIAALEAEFNITITGNIKERLADLNMYVRCQDTAGNKNTKDYAVNFCVKSGPDTTEPQIVQAIPVNGAIKKFGLNETLLKVYLSEPAECKYSKQDKSYAEMETPFVCETGLNDAAIYGWPCETLLSGLTSSIDTFYIKCKDQPWLTDDDSKRNINLASYVYKLHASSGNLKIDSISPQEEASYGFEPIIVTLQVETSGGAESGKAQCFYSFTGYEKMTSFFNTFSSSHSQVFDLMTRGNYNIYVKCQDNANNIASEKTSFTLNIDTFPPIIVRAFNSGGRLKLVTDEDAECYYDLNRCNFNIDNGTKMTTAFAREHYADWNTANTYRIRCKDTWGNAPIGCTLQVSPSSFI